MERQLFVEEGTVRRGQKGKNESVEEDMRRDGGRKERKKDSYSGGREDER